MKQRREKMNEVLKQIEEIGIVPVVVLNDANDAEPLAQALCDGGLPCAEVTFRYGRSRRIHPDHDREIPEHARRRRYCPDHRAGRPRGCSRS